MSGRDIRKEELLGRSLIVKALDLQTQQELATYAHIKSYEAGEVIFNAGSPGLSLIAIAEGKARVEVVTATGRDIILSELRKGDVFGEIALLDGGARSATVRASTRCTLVLLERSAVIGVLKRDPLFSIKLIELLCRRVRRSDERMMEIGFLNLPTRLARLILRLSEEPPFSKEKPTSRLSNSQSDLAKMIGNTRENVNRCLRKWQDLGHVALSDGWLVILDRQSLSELAED